MKSNEIVMYTIFFVITTLGTVGAVAAGEYRVSVWMALAMFLMYGQMKLVMQLREARGIIREDRRRSSR